MPNKTQPKRTIGSIALTQLATPDYDALNPPVTTAKGFSIPLSDLEEFICPINAESDYPGPTGLRIENLNAAKRGIGTDVVTSCVLEEPTAHKLICLEDNRAVAIPVDRHVLTVVPYGI
ncbi:hypothetical protein IW147_004445 [Coemansia sp. RSA 720]|nr:hypothetical protein IW147_004445 [Coemansia sp. RSA 720]